MSNSGPGSVRGAISASRSSAGVTKSTPRSRDLWRTAVPSTSLPRTKKGADATRSAARDSEADFAT